MTDVSRLTALLADYAGALEGHLGAVREEFAQLERAWTRLSEVYEGAAAEQFRSVFLATADRMHRYEHDATGLNDLLKRRTETLRRLDSSATDL